MNRIGLRHYLAVAALCAPLAFAAPALGQQPPERGIIEVAPDLYRFQDSAWFGLFLVTDEGIIVADPLNLGAAEWLAGELESRFDVPVRYVVYSHHHADHVSGAQVWPEATVVAHEAAVAPLTPPAEGAPLTGQFAAADANGDGVLQRDEAPPNVAANFDALDADGDGALTARELFAMQFGPLSPFGGVRMPDETWSGASHEITLGGQTVQMVHVEAAHSPDMALVIFPEQRTLFVVDIINTKRLPVIGPTFMLSDLETITEAALAQDFDIVVPGHGEIGDRADVVAHHQYHLDVMEGVRDGIAAGRSLEEIQADLTLEQYSEWSAYDRHGQNVAGAYASLTQD